MQDANVSERNDGHAGIERRLRGGQERAKLWFEELRDRMLAALEAVEDAAEGAPGSAKARKPDASPARPGHAKKAAAASCL